VTSGRTAAGNLRKTSVTYKTMLVADNNKDLGSDTELNLFSNSVLDVFIEFLCTN